MICVHYFGKKITAKALRVNAKDTKGKCRERKGFVYFFAFSALPLPFFAVNFFNKKRLTAKALRVNAK